MNRTDTGLAARAVALEVIEAVLDRGAYSNLVVPGAVATLDDSRDRAFAAHLAYDTIRWSGTLDWALDQVLTRPLADVEPALRHILRLGALQLLRSSVPARAAVSTSVELARRAVPNRRAKGAGGFVNGVLRTLDRTTLAWPDAQDEPIRALALRTAHPPWIVRELRDRFGHEQTRGLLEADNDPPGLTLRANGDRAALVAELRAAGLDATPGDVAESVRVPGADPRSLPAVTEGRARPQDEASMRVVHAAEVQPGEQVLDLCAGPGGKATHLARLVGSGGRVVAVELQATRAELVREAAAALGVEVDVRVGDAADPPLDPGERFDVVLLDAPCTALGTGRRRPEVRWRRTPDDVTTLADQQRRLLGSAARWLRPGGRLVYAVCTWTAAETTEVRDAFETTDAARSLVRVVDRQLRPDLDGTDGMYVAAWRAPASWDEGS